MLNVYHLNTKEHIEKYKTKYSDKSYFAILHKLKTRAYWKFCLCFSKPVDKKNV